MPKTSLREKARLAGLVMGSLAIGLIALELGLRAVDGQLSAWPNYVLQARTVLTGFQAEEYLRDETLGYVPRPGYSTPKGYNAPDIRFNEAGFRINGDAPAGSGAPVLAVGDSYTYGEEVNNGETWPAHLQRLTGRPVLNAGVAGYGFDQIVLRTQQLVPKVKPSAVVVSFIADDLRRTEMSRLWSADKPYFDFPGLKEHKVGPPTEPRRTLTLVQRVFGYSYLVDFVLRRLNLLEDWFGDHIRVHPAGTGEKIGCALMEPLRALGVPLLLVAQYDPYVFKGNKEQRRITEQMLACARARGLKVLDTYGAIAATRDPLGLYAAWHMNDKGNALVAQKIAEALR